MNTATPTKPKPKPRKLTTLEKRAKVMCEDITKTAADGYDFSLEVTWAKSSTWGMCPRIDYHGEKVAHASGCGYCKRSAVLAEALCWLGKDDAERISIARCQGMGESTVQRALLAIGWKLEGVASSKWADHYTLSRVQDGAK